MLVGTVLPLLDRYYLQLHRYFSPTLFIQLLDQPFAVGTRLHDSIKSGLARWQLKVDMDAVIGSSRICGRKERSP